MRFEQTNIHIAAARALASKKRLTGKDIKLAQKLLAQLSQSVSDLHKAILVEPEFSDSMPDDMFDFIKDNKTNAEKTFQAVVIQTKQGILQRFDKNMF